MGSLNILVVDDASEKASRVIQLLGERLKEFGPEFQTAKDYESAMASLAANYYDLVILDLLLPGAGQGPSQTFSRSLISQLLDGKLIAPSIVIGLTEYEHVATNEKIFYDANLFALELFSWTKEDWADHLANRIIYLVKAKRSSQSFQIQGYDLDLFVVVARHENEYKPIRDCLFSDGNAAQYKMPGWDIEACIGDMQLEKGRHLSTCLVCVGEMGVAPTTAVVAQAISTFRPRMVAMLGMCCGFEDGKCAYPQRLGNVLVVREVSCWEEGKFVTDGKSGDFRNRSKSRHVSERLRRPVELIIEKKAEHIDKALAKLRKKRWVKDLIARNAPLLDRDPEVRFAEIVTGSSFVADSDKISEIIDSHNSAVGLDMEIFGVYAAPDFMIGSKPLRLAVKGVADFGDGQDKPEIQALASVSAAIVFKQILTNIDLYDLTSKGG